MLAKCITPGEPQRPGRFGAADEEPGVSPLRASREGELEEVAIEIREGTPVLIPPEKRVAEKLPSPDQLFQPAPPPGILNGEIQKLERPFHRSFKKGLISSLPPERAADLAADVPHLLREGEAAPSAVGQGAVVNPHLGLP